MLVHHANTRRDCVARALERGGLSIQKNLPFVGLMQSVQDVHERGLTRAILPQQGMNLPFLDREVDRVVCDEGTEPLRDPPQL